MAIFKNKKEEQKKTPYNKYVVLVVDSSMGICKFQDFVGD